MTTSPFSIAGRRIGLEQPPFIIAEMSGNHNQSLDRALAIVDAAAAAGAHALKIQTYKADTMTLDLKEGNFVIHNPKSLWDGQTLYGLYEKAATPWEWHKPIFDRCRERGMIGFSTAFDATSVDFLESLSVPCHKVASFENIDIPLIRQVARTGKPLIISTGMATEEELRDSVQAAREAGCRDLLLMRCTSEYPADPKNSHLRTIPDLAGRFDCLVGLSDHTLGTGVSLASVALGAVAIEKHFTLSRADGGVDSAFSLEPDELGILVKEATRAWESLGKVQYGPSSDQERKSMQFRRSLYVVKDLTAGDVLTRDNVRSLRPSGGLAPKYLDVVIGKSVKRAVRKGSPLAWDFLA